MIWHILRKDAAVLWPIVAIAALAHLASAVVSIVLGPMMQPPELKVLGAFTYVSMLSLFALVGIVVHQEPLLGTEQDWLVRPIRRRDLLLSKLLFILVLGHGPLLVAGMVEGLGLGMGLGTSAGAAVSDGILKLMLVTVPSLCLASVTRSLTEMVVAGLGLTIACGLGMLMMSGMMDAPPAISSGGLAWMRYPAMSAAFLILALCILPLQYFRRRTSVSRALVLAGVLAFALTWTFTPWKPSYALQQHLGPSPGSSAFELRIVESGAFHRIAQVAAGADEARPLGSRAPAPVVRIALPLRVSGAAPESVLLMDRADVRLIDAKGRAIYKGTTRYFSARGARIEPIGTDEGGHMLTEQALGLPRPVYLQVQGKPMRLEIDYWITEMVSQPELRLSAIDGRVEEWAGRSCITHFDADDGDIDLRCLAATKIPSCVDVVVVNSETGDRNPNFSGCSANYAPHRFRSTPLSPYVVKRFGIDLPTYERSSSKPLPVSSTAIRSAVVSITPYEARAHYSRHLVVPDFIAGG